MAANIDYIFHPPLDIGTHTTSVPAEVSAPPFREHLAPSSSSEPSQVERGEDDVVTASNGNGDAEQGQPSQAGLADQSRDDHSASDSLSENTRSESGDSQTPEQQDNNDQSAGDVEAENAGDEFPAVVIADVVQPKEAEPSPHTGEDGKPPIESDSDSQEKRPRSDKTVEQGRRLFDHGGLHADSPTKSDEAGDQPRPSSLATNPSQTTAKRPRATSEEEQDAALKTATEETEQRAPRVAEPIHKPGDTKAKSQNEDTTRAAQDIETKSPSARAAATILVAAKEHQPNTESGDHPARKKQSNDKIADTPQRGPLPPESRQRPVLLPDVDAANPLHPEAHNTNKSSPEKPTSDAAPPKPSLDNTPPIEVVSTASDKVGQTSDRLSSALAPGRQVDRPAHLTESQQARLVERVAKAFDVARARGESSVRLRLTPPQLGSLQIELQVDRGALLARLEVETQTAREALLDNLNTLRNRLAEQDIRVDQFDVDVLDRRPDEQWGQSRQRGQSPTGNREGNSSSNQRDGDEQQATQQPTTTELLIDDGAIDVII